MPLQAGSRLGAYEILSALGAGGMGEVYRARDTKLNRDVAIKVLPDLFASDADRVARFRREAQVLAALNHPHIAAIYGFEDANDAPALVLEFVDGPTLADRITLGPIAIDDALPIARQIAEALEAAHDKGIIHRDLKPANVKLTADGKVKVLDFGLAKLIEAGGPGGAGTAGGPAGLSMSPTLSVHATYAGVILGTAAYMSPEQARGRPVDTRTDVWAFGCVLYEMLTARQIFPPGETVSDAIAAILTREPDWSALPPATPNSVRRLLRRCLDKDRAKRLHSAADARIEIDDAHAEPERAVAAPAMAPAPSRTRERIVWASALALVALAAVGGTLAWVRARASAVPAQETRLEISTPPSNDPLSSALSPDGRRIVFVASGDGPSRLWVRSFETAQAQPLPGTELASEPFWSPDGQSVGFFAGDQLKRLSIGGGAAQTITALPGGASRGATWSADGTILFGGSTTGGLYRVPASGGDPVLATRPTAGQAGHRYPQFLPGSRRFVFFVIGQADVAGIYLGSLDSSDTTRLTAADAAGTYVPGWLLFARQGALVARRFDDAAGALNGDPVIVANSVGTAAGGRLGASTSSTGLIAYRSGYESHQLAWFDRSGKTLGTLGERDDNTMLHVALSPDARRAAIYRTVQGQFDVWLVDTNRSLRFTTEPGRDMYPLWSPDGDWIVYSHDGKNPLDLYRKRANGDGTAELLVESPETKVALSWSPDGRLLLFGSRGQVSGGDLWILPVQGDRKPFPFLNSRFEERNGQFSPDGKWIVYESNESGRTEVTVRPFPGPGGQWQVSTNGGITPRWSHDGKEIYYVAPDGKLMAASFKISGGAPEIAAPVALFPTRIANGGAVTIGINWQYDVAADGRFLINVNTDDGGTAPITVVQNWTPKQ